ncbi:MAG: hypothetical protein J6R08_04985, partial [Opitutales bacterium]|nr:hypothetical protein [Opitutales bacterium]
DMYSVGDFFITRNATFNPASRFGGQWELLKDRFLLGAGGDFALGASGGKSKALLKVSDLPYHRHGIDSIKTSDDYAHGVAVLGSGIDISSLPKSSGLYAEGRRDLGYDRKLSSNTPADTMNMMSAGTEKDPIENYEQTEVDNMPPYVAVNIWVKISDEDGE